MTFAARTRTDADLRLQRALKSALDRGLAALALVLLSPLLAVVALAIRADSRGPVIFRQTRTGLDGRPFEILKFRSMHRDAGLAQARRGDVRVTRVGALLRRTSIDELPQLVNVLAGDMALVGPRPHACAHDAFYAPRIANYMARYAVRPGLTGWAQLNGARGATETPQEMAQRVALDLDYLRGWSLARDLRILALTPLHLLAGDNAY